MDLMTNPARNPAEEREPLFTGHRTHDELLEKARIEHARSSYGHGIPLFPQAMIYLGFLAALVIMLFLLLWATR
jgi:hypothetical protein